MSRFCHWFNNIRDVLTDLCTNKCKVGVHATLYGTITLPTAVVHDVSGYAEFTESDLEI